MPCRDFFERSAAKPSSPINLAPRPLSKSPVSFSLRDEVPHIVIRESHQRPREILISGGKGLFQQHRSTPAKLKVSKMSPLLPPLTDIKRTLNFKTDQGPPLAHVVDLANTGTGPRPKKRSGAPSQPLYMLQHATFLQRFCCPVVEMSGTQAVFSRSYFRPGAAFSWSLLASMVR